MSTRNFADLLRNFRGGTGLAAAVGKRLLACRKAARLTQVEAAELLGISGGYLSELESGKKKPSIDVLEKACVAYRQTLEWLLFGEEEGLPDEAEGVAEGDAIYCRQRLHRFELVGRVSANPEPDVIWEPVDPVEHRELPEGVVALEVRGDSMRPVAFEGQAVLAVELPVENGDLVAVEMKDGRQFFKRWWWREGRKLAILESVRREAIEPPVPIKLRDCRRVWKIVGVLF